MGNHTQLAFTRLSKKPSSKETVLDSWQVDKQGRREDEGGRAVAALYSYEHGRRFYFLGCRLWVLRCSD